MGLVLSRRLSDGKRAFTTKLAKINGQGFGYGRQRGEGGERAAD